MEQSLGPENVVVIQCRDLSRQIPLLPSPAERHRLLRLRRNLLIKFQAGKPELWIKAAEQVRAWLDDDRSVNFFEEAETESGESRFDEGEGKERSEDDEDETQPGEGHDRDGGPHHYDDRDRDHSGDGAGSAVSDVDMLIESRMRCCVVKAMRDFS